MKIKEGFVLRPVGKEYIAVAVGEACKEFSGIIRLNETAAFLWRQFVQDQETEAVVEALLKEYEIDKVHGIQEVEKFMKMLMEADILISADDV